MAPAVSWTSSQQTGEMPRFCTVYCISKCCWSCTIRHDACLLTLLTELTCRDSTLLWGCQHVSMKCILSASIECMWMRHLLSSAEHHGIQSIMAYRLLVDA